MRTSTKGSMVVGLYRYRKEYLFVMPAFLVLFGIMIYPIFYGFYLSFYDTLLGFDIKKFVGFGNYIEVLKLPSFWKIFAQSIYWTALTVIVDTVLGLAVAVFMSKNTIWATWIKKIVLIPWVCSSVVIALTWTWIYHGTFGVLSDLILKVGLIKQMDQILWLGDPRLSLTSVTLVNIWKGFPFGAIMLYAAIEGISQELYEAARVDGCNAWQSFWHVTIPGIRNTLIVCILFGVVWTFNYFDLI
ncbi:sugar ABC transporter permease [Candidatus Sumerlaeota bacterium]|nr:sugar ABC transporter permease [Candidatus Sumerlaeota bacterium]